MRAFALRVLSPERMFYEGDCESLVFPAADGAFGVQAKHGSMISAIVPGVLEFRTPDGVTHTASVSEGLIKVEDGEALVLVDTIERPEEIDVRRAEERMREAKEALRQKQSLEEFRVNEARLARSAARLKTKNKKL